MKMEHFGSPSTCLRCLLSPMCWAVIDLQVRSCAGGGCFPSFGICTPCAVRLLGSIALSARKSVVSHSPRVASGYIGSGRELYWMSLCTALRNGREVPAWEVEQQKCFANHGQAEHRSASQTFLPSLRQRSAAMRMGGLLLHSAGASKVKPSTNKTREQCAE